MAAQNGAGLDPCGSKDEAGKVVGIGERDNLSVTPASAQIQAGEFYSASPIKRFRRTKANIKGIRDAILEILSADHPQTVRQVFYALTVKGVVKKDENEYQHTVGRLLVDMREENVIPFGHIADNTRWMRKPGTFVGAGILPPIYCCKL